MIIKKIPSAGHFAWSNSKKNSYMFATGTLRTPEVALLNLDQENYLQIFSLDTGDKSEHLTCLGRTSVESSFSSLAWDNFGEDNQYPNGIIVGGLSDGSIAIYDAHYIINYCKKHNNQNIEANIGCISYSPSVFAASVNAVEFNPFKPNLIATGGSCEVSIMNIERNISEPEIFSPGTPNLHEGSIISSVSWNKKVQHILASASLNGLTVVWDLKTNKPIFNFKDNSIAQNRNVSLAWNPEIPTQIAASFDDERNSELQIWDLRNPQGPVVLFGQGHSKGINCVNWCTNDSSLILTGGRDDKIICWNYKSSEIVSETMNGENISTVKWSPKIPSIFAVTGQSGNVTINTLSSDEVNSYAPKWYKTPTFSRFGPNNKILSFSEDKENIISEYMVKRKCDFVNKELLSFEQKFNDAERNNDFQKYCDKKLNENIEDISHWNFLKAIGVEKSNFSNIVIETLGFSKNEIIKNSENYTGKTHRKKEEGSPSLDKVNKTNKNNNFDFTVMSSKDAEDFFDKLIPVVNNQNQTETHKGSVDYRRENSLDQEFIYESVSKNVNWDSSIEKIIKQNILIGNYEGAIDCALKCGRNGEALLLAHSHSDELFEATANAFFVASKDTFIKNVFKNIVEKQNKEIAKNYEISQWREVAALSVSTKKNEEFIDIMNILGQRLIDEKSDYSQALLCFILARNLEKILDILHDSIVKLPRNSNSTKLKVIISIEKLIVFFKLTGILPKNNSKFDYLVEEFAKIANEYNCSQICFAILQYGSDKSLKIALLRDFIYNSNEDLHLVYKAPQIPFKIEHLAVKISKKQMKSDQKNDQGNIRPKNEIFGQNKGNLPPKDNIPQKINQPPNRPPTFVPQNPGIDSSKSQPIGPPMNQPSNERKIFNPAAPLVNKAETNEPQHSEKKFNAPPPNPKMGFNPSNIPLPPHKNPVPPESNLKEMQPNMTPPKKSQDIKPNISGPPPYNQIPEPKNISSVNPPGFGQIQPPLRNLQPSLPPNQQNIPSNSQPLFNQNQMNIQQGPNNSINVNNANIPRQIPMQKNAPPPKFVAGPPSFNNQQGPPPVFGNKNNENKVEEIKKEEIVTKKADFGNLNQNSSYIVETINKSKNFLNILEPNMRKRMDLEKTLDLLNEMVASESLKTSTYNNLLKMLQNWEAGNIDEALKTHGLIAEKDWDQNKDWLKTIKRVIVRK